MVAQIFNGSTRYYDYTKSKLKPKKYDLIKVWYPEDIFWGLVDKVDEYGMIWAWNVSGWVRDCKKLRKPWPFSGKVIGVVTEVYRFPNKRFLIK